MVVLGSLLFLWINSMLVFSGIVSVVVNRKLCVLIFVIRLIGLLVCVIICLIVVVKFVGLSSNVVML